MPIVMTSLALLVGCFLFPTEAFAWGPITHMDYAVEALQHLSQYPAPIRSLLTTYSKDFLYGSLAADITVGKSYVDYLYNCHNWRVGFLLLNEARDERQQASAYGYLVHLASDIVAHNVFVPTKTIRSYPTRTLGHVYWEMRFDAKRPKRIWKLARQICEDDFSHNDELFQRMLKRTLFSFKTNKRIFNSILNLHRFEKWRTGMEKLDRTSKWTLARKDVALYRQATIDSVVNFLKDPDQARCTRVDPTGADKLLYAKTTRRHLSKAYRRKKISRKEGDEFVTQARAALRHSLYEKDVELPDVADLFL